MLGSILKDTVWVAALHRCCSCYYMNFLPKQLEIKAYQSKAVVSAVCRHANSFKTDGDTERIRPACAWYNLRFETADMHHTLEAKQGVV